MAEPGRQTENWEVADLLTDEELADALRTAWDPDERGWEGDYEKFKR